MSVTFLVYADLASLACMPSALYVSPMFFLHFFYFCNGETISKEISGTTEQIFTKFTGLVELCKGCFVTTR